MQRAMVFIDHENFSIALHNYYRKRAMEEATAEALQQGLTPPLTAPYRVPRLDYNQLPKAITGLLSSEHALLKTFLFAPKPDEFLMRDVRRQGAYNWITGLKNQNYFTVVEGRHSARPVGEHTYATMDINDPTTYYVEEKGTDINVAAHLITKGFMNAYDTAIIVSGDTDYIPVMDILNTMGRTVVIAGVVGQNLYSFKHHADQQIMLDNAFFQNCLRE